MRTKLLRSPWTPGPDHGRDGPVLVSVTDFKPDNVWALPGIYRAARRLAHGWQELEGAYGMWLWAQPLARRCGSVAVWRDEAALHRFIAWAPHVDIMRAYRGRGALASTTWRSDAFDPAETWAYARTGLLA
ncbi:hypothetical protein ADL22_10535 [Streptomyces sp. NRRL F-4489]|uniref:hypothetical protein n=1 Tax=Streptomyces sp. NRRL F-4489 TaxID=1609095 RepID=UPI0007471B7E|nr:hypothetical protein [Streptomyces sp. NRRL F-4489]KUL45966.1 hypothetical protein ADL22_10535 [Streptomyces sp. NRRL F-4489]